MATFILGKDAKLYHGTAGATATTEISNVRDVTLTLEAGEADVTTRANSERWAEFQAVPSASVRRSLH
jgi:hypothetical protein